MLRGRGRRSRLATISSVALFMSAIGTPAGGVQAVSAAGIDVDWERTIPTDSGTAAIQAMTSVGSDVIVAGQISGEVPGGSSAGSGDVWVARYTGAGELAWITQFGTDSADMVTSIAASDRGIYLGGWTLGHFEGEPFDAQRDFVASLSASGAFQWAHEAEQSTNANGAHVAVAPNGDMIALLGDHTSGPEGTGFIGSIRRYGSAGSLLWERQISACCGSTQPLTQVEPSGVAGDAGGVTVTGFSAGSIEPATKPDATGGFTRRYGYDGSIRWTSYVGVSPTWGPAPAGVAASESGIWIRGTSSHPITDDPDRSPDPNPFIRRYADSGVVMWTKAITAAHSVGDCASILVTGDIPPAADPPSGPGAFVARIHPDGTTEWQFASVPAPEQLIAFLDVARSPERVFLAIERENGQYSVAALSGVPARADCDMQSPTVSAPAARFVTGTTLTSTVPVRVSWTATDSGSGLAGYDFLEKIDATAWATRSERQLSRWAISPLRVGHLYRFAIRAVDRANRSTLGFGPLVSVVRRENTSARVTYRGSWRTIADAKASGGSMRASSTPGASATFTFTGRAVAWVAPVGPSRGAAWVYVDGRALTTVRLTASSFAERQVVFARSWASEGPHSLRIVVVGTVGHPRVDIDAFVTLE